MANLSDVDEKQVECLERTIEWAIKVRTTLQPLLESKQGLVHFRPSSGGVSMVGLTLDRPQRGRSGVRDLKNLYQDFEHEFMKYCLPEKQGRPTAEKRLQSFLISQAYLHKRQMKPINSVLNAAGDLAQLEFVTDEIAVPGKKRIVCDILALRTDKQGKDVPVVLELKSLRSKKRLIQQVLDYAELVDRHQKLYEQLYSIILGRQISFKGKTEKWIVWPWAGDGKDPQATQFSNEHDIRVISYRECQPYTFQL